MDASSKKLFINQPGIIRLSGHSSIKPYFSSETAFFEKKKTEPATPKFPQANLLFMSSFSEVIHNRGGTVTSSHHELQRKRNASPLCGHI